MTIGLTATKARMQNGSGDGNEAGRGTAVITRTKTKTKKPSLYRVLILNDDYTPMEFVVHVLERFSRRTAKPPHASCFMFTIMEWASAGSIHSRWPRPKCPRSWISPDRISIRCNA